MNKRIKELAEQAGLRFTQLMSNPMVPVVDGKETDLEKFAELIVAECIGMLDDEDDYGPYSTGIRSAAYRIKKHFGVEE